MNVPPETRCIQCGVSYRENRAEQVSAGAPFACAIEDPMGEIEREWSRHKWQQRGPLLRADVAVFVEEALRTRQTTDAILDHLGIQYDSVVKDLRGTDVKARFQAQRREENYERRYSSRF